MAPDKHWVIPEEIQVPEDFQTHIGGHPLVAQTLYRRGVQTIQAAQSFLDPDAYLPTSADELPDIHIAYELLAKALQNEQRILVWGDFDVDGQTATTTLVEGLRKLGGQVRYHIPVRGEESHGINREVLSTFIDQGFDLLLTCDTGISEHENIQYVWDVGIPVIVTDHHTLTESLPPAQAVINPQRLSSVHPLRTLPAVGVAYKLMEGLFAHLDREFDAGRFQELTALGIVADVAELQGDTRYLLQKGLANLRQTQRIGLQTLYKNADLIPLQLNEDHIGFQIAPRLNAVGRLADANPMVEFLTTDDPGRARVLAAQIEALNAKRRFATRQVEKATESQLQNAPDDRHAPAIVLHHPDWPGGVVGIVASRLVERYQKPAILLTGKDPIHGSARSVEGINITEAIATQADLLTNFGGHPMAAGLSLPAEKLPAFKRGFLSAIEDRTKEIVIHPEIQVNRVIALDEISLELIQQVERLAPFGPANPPLHFMLRDLSLVSATGVGQYGEHRQVIVTDESEKRQRFIWWNGGDQPLPEANFDLVCKLSQSDYKGSLHIGAEWVDYRLSEKGRQQVAERQFEIIDHRQALRPLKELKHLLQTSANLQVWGEGPTHDEINALSRHQLVEGGTLVVWTAPPSHAVLQDVLQKNKPEKVVLFGLDPELDNPKTLMARLGGLAKYAIHHKEGRTPISHLASACAVETETIRIGLQLWVAIGEFKVKFNEDEVWIVDEKLSSEKETVEILKEILNVLLSESRAYRRYFRTSEMSSVLQNQSRD